jgi:hypothetical protein
MDAEAGQQFPRTLCTPCCILPSLCRHCSAPDLVLPADHALAYLDNGLLDSDVDKLTAPLENEKVDTFKLRKGEDEVLAEVERKERPYFVQEERAVTTTRDGIWLEGTLNSFAKDKNRGTFYTNTGKHIPYQFVGEDNQELLTAFAQNGSVRIHGKVSFDSDLTPIRVEISQVQSAQTDLFSQPDS